MKLQSDPTIIYGITRGYPLGRGIRQSEIEPRDALQHLRHRGPAAAADLQSRQGFDRGRAQPGTARKDLYFVADGTGGHVFAATVDEQAKNVAKWRKHRETMEGAPIPAQR